MNKLYNDIDVLLILTLTEIAYDKKTMYKRAIKLLKQSKPKVIRAILNQILSGKVSAASDLLDEFCHEYLYYATPAAVISAAGHDGMMIYNGEAIPIDVWYESQEDYYWALPNEEELYTAAVFDVMEKESLESIEAEFLMFSGRGYRGIPKWWGAKGQEGRLRLLSIVSPDTTELVGRISQINGRNETHA